MGSIQPQLQKRREERGRVPRARPRAASAAGAIVQRPVTFGWCPLHRLGDRAIIPSYVDRLTRPGVEGAGAARRRVQREDTPRATGSAQTARAPGHASPPSRRSDARARRQTGAVAGGPAEQAHDPLSLGLGARGRPCAPPGRRAACTRAARGVSARRFPLGRAPPGALSTTVRPWSSRPKPSGSTRGSTRVNCRVQ